MKDLTESEKSKLRYDYLTIRDRLEPALRSAYSRVILSRIKKLESYQNAKVVMFYLSYGSEVVTDTMINEVLSDGKDVVVPVIQNPGDGIMTAIRITHLEDCYEAVYGIRQPEFNENEIVDKQDVDLIFVPGIVFDSYGYRIGYGKGYYDRWLAGTDISKRVGLAYEVQLIDKIPSGKYDLPVSIVLTEKRLIEVTRN
ncbi:MAG: 5-formyltetrahydrofolate cyclo-ligase [Endomicrobiia bacterium]|nr:5-formyltetrahydrofolate cyclo-ligase [Endomicrobiaceae bacterium]MDD3053555.1 5-formyltetrahydrofolate cyclo-ligase [Endomicrobiaceae bacterium]MDD3922340.1 5-formyltetrahydrofolate cyclo-ligase [Endomicrobiaceae bacterium]MDD5102152.1 5-formyltetrahydrofolate cyclo-ligase [Endomicrobiaceae bacterium]